MQALFAFLALALGGADVYRWVDADGQAHYSDRASPGAEKVTIVVSPPATSPAADGADPTDSAKAPVEEEAAPVLRYKSLTITSPAEEQVLWNIDAQLDVAAAVQPALQPDHVLRFYLDGRMVPAEPGSTRAQFSEVFRGEHSLRVEVVDSNGQDTGRESDDTLLRAPDSAAQRTAPRASYAPGEPVRRRLAPAPTSSAASPPPS